MDFTEDGKVIMLDTLRPRPEHRTPADRTARAVSVPGPRKRTVRRRHPRHRFLKAAAALLCLLAVLVWRSGGIQKMSPMGQEADQGGTVEQYHTAGAVAEPVTTPDWVVESLLPINEYSRPGTKLDGVNGVVVHYTGNPGTTAEQNRSYFGNLAETHETYASSHFVIGMDGTVIQCVPLDEVAYCSSYRNSDTISIECCHPDETGAFTQATLDALTKLLDWLIDTYSLEWEGILRHYDVTGKECPKYYVTHPDAWEELLDRLVFPSNR